MALFKIKDSLFSNTINFVAYAITPWHAIGVNSVIESLNQKGVNLNGFIVVVKHTQAGFLIDQSNFCYSSENQIQVIYENEKNRICFNLLDVFSVLLYDFEERENFYIVNAWKPKIDLLAYFCRVKKGFNLINYFYDEGLATYLSKPYNNNKGQIKYLLEQVFFCFLKRKKIFVRFLLFQKKKNRLVIDKEVSSFYKKCFSLNNCSSIYDFSNSVILNTQVYHLENQLDNNCDLLLYSKLAEICAELNLNLYLKPHPREKDLERYQNIRFRAILPVDIPQELMLSDSNKPLALIGITSTSLISARIFWGIPIISLGGMLHGVKTGDRFKNDLSSFRKCFSSYFFDIENECELQSILQKIVVNGI